MLRLMHINNPFTLCRFNVKQIQNVYRTGVSNHLNKVVLSDDSH